MTNTCTTPCAGTSKAATRAQWDRAAEGWDRQGPRIAAWLRTATDAMLDLAAIRIGDSVLDVAAGAGDQTMDIARRVGPTGRVLATDLSDAILALAKRNATRAGLRHVQVQQADGEALGVGPAAFDAAVCRLGLMLFPEPLRGLQEMRRAVRPGGRVCTIVFSRPENNPCIAILMSTALKHAGLAPRDPFQPGGLLSLGKPGLVDERFRAAGLAGVATTTIDAPFRLPSARDYLDFVRCAASPVQQILGNLDTAAAEAAWCEMEERLQAFNGPDGWSGPNELLLTVGRA